MNLRQLIMETVEVVEDLGQDIKVREITRGPNGNSISARECTIARVAGTGNVVIEATQWVDSKPI